MRRLGQVDAPDLSPPDPAPERAAQRRRLALALVSGAAAIVLTAALVVALRDSRRHESDVRAVAGQPAAATSTTPSLLAPGPSTATVPVPVPLVTTPPLATTTPTTSPPVTQGGYTDFAIPTANSGPHDIIVGPDGAIWFTEQAGNMIGRLDPATGKVTELPVPTANAAPSGITAGPDGALWFTEAGANLIGRITTRGTVTEYPIPTNTGNPLGPGGSSAGVAAITTGPDGAPWFVESLADEIGRITTGGQVTEYSLPDRSLIHGNPGGIAAGPDGGIWFTEQLGNRVDRLDPATGRITSSPVAGASGPVGLVTLAGGGANGTLWFSQTGKIGNVVAATGEVTLYDAPAASMPGGEGVAVSPVDKAVWFTENRAGKLGRATPSGDVTEVSIPRPDAGPSRLVVDAKGTVWITEAGANRIGRLAPS